MRAKIAPCNSARYSRTTAGFAKIAIRSKICCITYKNICTYQKKAVPLHHERRNKKISTK